MISVDETQKKKHKGVAKEGGPVGERRRRYRGDRGERDTNYIILRGPLASSFFLAEINLFPFVQPITLPTGVPSSLS